MGIYPIEDEAVIAEAVVEEIFSEAQASGQYEAFAKMIAAQMSALPKDQRGPWFTGPDNTLSAERVEHVFREQTLVTVKTILERVRKLGFVIVRAN